MTLPKPHLRSLDAALKDHEARLEQLRAEARFLQEEIVLHATIVALGREEQILAAVGELEGKSDVGVRFAENAAEYCDEQGVRLPDGVTLNPRRGPEGTTWVIGRVQSGDWEVDLLWDPAKGFAARPVKQPPTLFPWLNQPPQGES
jgi:hypothetical protein